MHPMYADWVKHVYHADSQGRVIASEKHSIGLLIKNLLRPRPSNPVAREYEPEAFVEFILPNYDDFNTTEKNYITENSEKLIYIKVRRQFYYDLHDFIEEITNAGISEIRTIIILFCEKRNISNFKKNTLEREYRRYKKKQKNFRETRKMSSIFIKEFSFLLPLIVLSSPFC